MAYVKRDSKLSPTNMTWRGEVTESNKYWYTDEYNAGATNLLCLPNCTTYAMGRAGEIAKKSCRNYEILNRKGFPNASDWWNVAKWERSDVPSLGAIACWTDNGKGWGGHVAVVESTDGTKKGTMLSMSGYVGADNRSFSNPGDSVDWYFKYLNFETTNYYYTTYNNRGGTFQGFLVNPYAGGEDPPTPPTPPTPSLVDIIEFTNNNQYAYIEWDSSRKDSSYDYKLQLVAPLFSLAGIPNTVTDTTMKDWELIARINGGFFFIQGAEAFANGVEKQHYTWNEQYDDTEYDNVMAIGSDGSDNTILSIGSTSSFRTFKGEWCLTGGTSLSGGARINGDVDSDTGHSFLAYNGRKIIMGVSKSGVSGFSLRNYLTSLGYAGVELDGGSSTAFNYLGVDYNNTGGASRVKNVICLYRKKKKQKKLGRNDIRLDNSITVKALEVLIGKYGSGFIRKHKLGKEYADVQYQVNYLIHNYHLYELLAFEVLVGLWGNGRTRKRKLEAKGYNYYKVQAYVGMYKNKKVL